MAQFDVCKMFNAERLISCVRARPIIWDQTSDEFSNKLKKKEAWLEICRDLYEGFDDFDSAKKNEIGKCLLRKWKSLRDCFSREIKKRKTCNSASGDHKKYIYYNDLIFLEQNFQSNAVCNVDDGDEENSSHSVKRKSVKKETFSKSGKAPIVKPPTDEVASKNIDLQAASNIEENEHSSVDDHPVGDADKLFMLSLVKDLKAIPSERRFQAKCEIMAVISKYKNASFPVTTTNSLPLPNPNQVFSTNFPVFCLPQAGHLFHSSQFPVGTPQPCYQSTQTQTSLQKLPFSPYTTSSDERSTHSDESGDIDFN